MAAPLSGSSSNALNSQSSFDVNAPVQGGGIVFQQPESAGLNLGVWGTVAVALVALAFIFKR